MKIQNKRFVYLISPTKILDNTFFKTLELVFKSKKVSFFQLRLKNEKLSKKILISKKIIKTRKKYELKFSGASTATIAYFVMMTGCISASLTSFTKAHCEVLTMAVAKKSGFIFGKTLKPPKILEICITLIIKLAALNFTGSILTDV